MPDKRSNVAFALFAHMYRHDIADDPTFPDRLWKSLTEAQRSLWFEQADVAISAGV